MKKPTMTRTLLLIILLPPSVVAYVTPEPITTTKTAKLPKRDVSTPPTVFPRWPHPVVEAKGDYRNELYLEDVIGGPLYSKQSELPRLPVPTLEETIDTFLPTALPLAKNEKERKSLLEACRKFPSEAKVLQERLLKRKEEYKDSSWLQRLWTDSYLTYRDPVAVFVSYFLFVPDDSTLPKDLPVSKGIARAAAILTAMGQSRKLLATGTMPAEVMGENNYMCSSFFKYMLHSCRIPQESKDFYKLYDPSLHQHCIVASRGHFFAVDFVDENTGEPLPLQVLQNRLQRCVELSEDGNAPQLGWLTSQNRDDWAKARQTLLDVGGDTMKEAFSKLEGGAFVLNLDDEEPESMTDAARIFWHGGDTCGGNRWFDKPLQLICTKNGRVAYMGEHSMLDAAPAIPLITRILKTTYKRLCRKQSDSTSSSDYLDGVTDIFADCWSLPTLKETAENLVSNAREHHAKLTNDYEIKVEEFKGYGKPFIKNAGFTCHDYAQMALQLASYRLFGELAVAYEAALTRSFLNGRTETIRPLSPESRAFVECMGLKPNPDVDRETKLELLNRAAAVHDQYQQKASEGMGVDRHFFGLSSMKDKGEDAPSLLSHPLFEQSQHWRLSTSTVTYAPGFGPVTEDGLGIGYLVGKDSCIFTCTSRKENNYVNRFCELLDEALVEMGDLLKEDSISE